MSECDFSLVLGLETSKLKMCCFYFEMLFQIYTGRTRSFTICNSKRQSGVLSFLLTVCPSTGSFTSSLPEAKYVSTHTLDQGGERSVHGSPFQRVGQVWNQRSRHFTLLIWLEEVVQ